VPRVRGLKVAPPGHGGQRKPMASGAKDFSRGVFSIDEPTAETGDLWEPVCGGYRVFVPTGSADEFAAVEAATAAVAATFCRTHPYGTLERTARAVEKHAAVMRELVAARMQKVLIEGATLKDACASLWAPVREKWREVVDAEQAAFEQYARAAEALHGAFAGCTASQAPRARVALTGALNQLALERELWLDAARAVSEAVDAEKEFQEEQKTYQEMLDHEDMQYEMRLAREELEEVEAAEAREELETATWARAAGAAGAAREELEAAEAADL
jgi:hypothetical protein